MPVFIRTVAIMFIQAGLLPRNHPAASYGAPDVRKYGFFELMGESWRTLRQGSATPYQWGLFVAVCFMISYVFLAAFQVLFGLSGMMIGSASAQIFSHPSGPTDISTIPPGSGDMFDHAIPSGGAHADLGIMILDKMLREGTRGVSGPGGSLQVAFGSLMQVYNTAVLVIAGVMLFWAILSVVVDTAKTGQVGGGRHNMVWAPIRIVFALGLLIPLGSSGFSSGQFMVMKLAEWGSNLGTRGWSAYVSSVATQSKLIAMNKGPDNLSELIGQYAGMWICRVAYNGEAEATGALNDDQRIVSVNKKGVFDSGKRTFSFTNKTASDICGTITITTDKDPATQFSRFMNSHPSPGGAWENDYMLSSTLATYQNNMHAAYAGLFVNEFTGSIDDGSLNLDADVKGFACQFASMHVAAAALVSSGECGSVSATPTYPDISSIETMSTIAYNNIALAITTAAPGLESVVKSDMELSAQKEGWAAMGRWYHQISSANHSISKMTTPTVSISAGAPPADENSHLNKKVIEVNNQYAKWWQTVPGSTANQPGGGTLPKPWETPNDKPQIKGFWGSVFNIIHGSAGGSPATMISGMADLIIFSQTHGYFLFDLGDPDAADTYPLAQLSAAGHSIVKTGLGIIGAVTVVQVVAGWLGASYMGNSPFGQAGLALGSGALSQLFATMGTVILMSGMLLTVYVPMIPLVRTVFSVLTWMISVFEAVVMVPIAALAHITTEGEGLAGNAKQAWILWLNVLLRPILTVIGFVAALLIFNTFLIYFHRVFLKLTAANFLSDGIWGFFSIFSNTIIYVGIVYLAANSTFKLLDLMPNAMMKWIGGGQPDHSFDEHEATAGFISAGGQAASSFGSSLSGVSGQVAGGVRAGREHAINMDIKNEELKAAKQKNSGGVEKS